MLLKLLLVQVPHVFGLIVLPPFSPSRPLGDDSPLGVLPTLCFICVVAQVCPPVRGEGTLGGLTSKGQTMFVFDCFDSALERCA